jgi:hypothetical protein
MQAKLIAFNVRQAQTSVDIDGNYISNPNIDLWKDITVNLMGFFLGDGGISCTGLLELTLGDFIRHVSETGNKPGYQGILEYARDHIVPCLKRLIPDSMFHPEIYELVGRLFSEAAKRAKVCSDEGESAYTYEQTITEIANTLLKHENAWNSFRFVAKMTLYAHM